MVLQAQERPAAYVAATIWAALVTTAVTVWLVVRGGGAAGYLQGALIGAALAALPYLALTVGQIRPVFRTAVLTAALAYSLPLVPHALAGWALEMSDRAILTRLIPLHDVGVYSLGYQLGAAMGLITTAFNAAWVPFLFGELKEEGEAAHPKLARLVTYYAAALCFVGLGWALLVKHAIGLLAGPEFHEAHRITPWVVGGYVLQRALPDPHQPAVLAPPDPDHSAGHPRGGRDQHRAQPPAGAAVRRNRGGVVHARGLRGVAPVHLVERRADSPVPLRVPAARVDGGPRPGSLSDRPAPSISEPRAWRSPRACCCGSPSPSVSSPSEPSTGRSWRPSPVRSAGASLHR